MPAENGTSVVIITRARPDLLRACLDSALRGGEPPLEFLVGVNGSDPVTLRLLEGYGGALKAVPLPAMCRGEARAALAARALGRWLCFLDDDTVLPAGYFSRLSKLINGNPGISVFGGGQELHPGAAYFERAVYSLLASPWGGGPFTERFSPVSATGPAGPEKFILCNLTLDSWFLKARGLSFDGHVTSAEENLLLGRMAGAGARMVLSGELNVIHRRRSGLGGFAAQVFSSGRGRAQITALYPRGLAAFTLIPPAALLAAACLAFAEPRMLGWFITGYLLVSLAAAARCGAGPAVKPAVFALFPALHSSYAAGWFSGAAEIIAEKILRRARPGRCRCE
jgi:hypothetical protein